MRRLAIVGCACAIVAALALPGTASARTKIVYAGDPPNTLKVAAKLLPKGFVKKYQPSANAFFLHRVTINVGDSVRFLNAGFHDVDLPGTGDKLLPLIMPLGGVVSGENDAAGNPFWFDGKLPVIGYNPQLFKPSGPSTYDGTKRIDSGLPFPSGGPNPLVVKFSKAGTYKYYCDVHPGMIGFVVVKSKGQKIPSAKQDAAAVVGQIKAEVSRAKKTAKSKIPAHTVRVGLSAPGLELYNMFPGTLTVKRGTVVTFSMSPQSYEAHTATFGPAKYLNGLAKAFEAPKIPGAAAFPSDPTQPLVLSRGSHGNGFANTGVIDTDRSTPTNPTSSKIEFAQTGTYHYICLIHPWMRGTIVVK